MSSSWLTFIFIVSANGKDGGAHICVLVHVDFIHCLRKHWLVIIHVADENPHIRRVWGRQQTHNVKQISVILFYQSECFFSPLCTPSYLFTSPLLKACLFHFISFLLGFPPVTLYLHFLFPSSTYFHLLYLSLRLPHLLISESEAIRMRLLDWSLWDSIMNGLRMKKWKGHLFLLWYYLQKRHD